MQDDSGFQLASLLRASWQGAVLIVLVLGVQWTVGRRLHPRWRYGLWLLVLLRLALPWTLPSPASLFNVLTFPGLPLAAAAVRTEPGSENPATALPAVVAPADSAAAASAFQAAAPAHRLRVRFSWLPALWSAGALALTVYLLVTHYRLARRVSRRRPLLDVPVLNLLEDCKQQMGVRVPLTLVETEEVGSPALFGFVRPRLLLPAGLARSFSETELRHVFRHELGHVKRHDILLGWLMTALQILHWFNPLVWLAFHRMRVDRELACDALALSYVRPEEHQAYGHTIIKLLESFGRPARAPSLAGTVENRNQMKERIRMIATFKKSNRGFALAAALFAGLGLITLTDAQPGASQLARELIGTWILAGRPGEVGEPPAAGGRLKFLTGTHWCDTQADPSTGEVLFHHGGTYTLNGKDYVQTTDFANPSTKGFIGKTGKFTIKVEGDTLTLIGVGNPWKEVWKRARTAAHKSDPALLQGTWSGEEAGADTKDAARLTIRGLDMEFHGADTNEWYKAGIAVYDTTPKQLVITFTDCPAPEYVGRTAYAIYRVQEGTLTITGNEPGSPVAPAGFDSPGSRKFVFRRK